MPSADAPSISISAGDPAGIGPEVIVKALAEESRRDLAWFRIHAAPECLEHAAKLANIAPFWNVITPDSTERPPVALVAGTDDRWRAATQNERPIATAIGGALSFSWVERAVKDCQGTGGYAARCQGLVTGPISKHAWALAGRSAYAGHTELLADLFGATRTAMMFFVPGDGVRPAFYVALATAHVPLMEVASKLSIARVQDVVDLALRAMGRIGVKPRIAICGLNPHAGEEGLLGDEEERIIIPAIERMREAGYDVHGPFPGDTIFQKALKGEYQLFVAMYHDQGLIPVKLIAFDRAVNVTAGLPVIRTSPDHGTAFDIAGRNVADAGSMKAAIEYAVRGVRR